MFFIYQVIISRYLQGDSQILDRLWFNYLAITIPLSFIVGNSIWIGWIFAKKSYPNSIKYALIGFLLLVIIFFYFVLSQIRW